MEPTATKGMTLEERKRMLSGSPLCGEFPPSGKGYIVAAANRSSCAHKFAAISAAVTP